MTLASLARKLHKLADGPHDQLLDSFRELSRQVEKFRAKQPRPEVKRVREAETFHEWISRRLGTVFWVATAARGVHSKSDSSYREGSDIVLTEKRYQKLKDEFERLTHARCWHVENAGYWFVVRCHTERMARKAAREEFARGESGRLATVRRATQAEVTHYISLKGANALLPYE